ncbi:hypothetical protein ID866_2681 [Astraeus odoratus]|nr:hypothetical protein ID866_2681 [Astraeus odoratus]
MFKSTVKQKAAAWLDFSKIKNLIIFGDSYSAVGYSVFRAGLPHPAPSNPLGVPFPGSTWVGQYLDEPNWVGHLLMSHLPGKKYIPPSRGESLPSDTTVTASESSMVVYDFAVGGHTVEGVRNQILRQFIPHVAAKPSWAAWGAEDTLFVTWVGINDLPATIQRRFFSFVLRKTLGRFLKPGQLDLHQIDSQLGSGAVHVTDLELKAINELLGGLPLRLHDGYISGVTVRVPFPNPLTSSVGLHVRALHLTLYVVTDQRTPPVPPLFSGAGLADSVASVAQTFVHRELTPKEEATLRESLHPGHVNHVLTDESENLPGGFDPFVRHRDRDDAREVQGATQTDNDPVGVSVFASFIERLLARFEFSALDTKITVVHPGKSSFTFTVREVLYRTRDDEGQCSQTPSDRKPSPETGDLGRFQGQIHDDVQLMMSQSIATLPPRPLSPASSVASTMYQSVMSSSIQGTGEYTSQVHAPVVACPETPTPENVKATLSDISLFAFHAVSTARDSQVAAPIIISDYYLPVLGTASYFRPSFTSERPSRIQLPMFDVVDWTQTKFQGNSTRLSTWRTKRRSKADKLRSPLQRNRDLPSPPNPFVISPLAEDGETFLPPAIEVIGRCLPSETSDLHIKVAPLHVFLDLAMIFDGNVLFKFVHEITSSSMFALENNRCAPGSATDWNPRGSSAFNDHEDSDNLVHNTMSAQPQERELERRRLERLVLDDLNLGMNHGVGPKALKELRNSTGQQECHRKRKPPLRSASSQVGIGTAQLREITIAYAKSNEDQARTVLMLGSMPESTGDAHASTLFASDKSTHALPVCLRLGRITRPNHGQPTIPERLSLVVDVPLINLIIDKESFDGLQYWADDVARLLEHSVSEADSLTETLPSRNPSLIGSRFFVRARKTSSHGEDSTLDSPIHESPANSGETVVKVNITEALLRISLPREQDLHHTRPFDIQASDIDVLLELKPEGKDETVITAGVMDLRVADTSALGSYTPLVVLTAPRSLSATPKPMAKARIASLVVPETIAKESKIKLSLWGITCYVPSELGFASDLALFAKAPPGVFESVVPSERTALSIGVIDVSVMVQAPEHPGASVLHIGEADFSTEILFIVDSIRDASESLESLQKPSGNGVTLWKSSGDNSIFPPDQQVDVSRIELRVHLCADTLAALTGFISHLVPKDNTNDLSDPARRGPSTLAIESDHQMIVSLDEDAFRGVPEVGNTADMINDDLPANLDYLDASFGAAAGLRELRDDDLEDFDINEQSGRTTPVPGETGVVSNVGGETIRVFRRLSFKEHHFDTITPEVAGNQSYGDTSLRVRVHDADITLFLHDGYDWPRTRRIIEKEIKEMRKKLARIRQLVATGQTQEPIEEETSAMLFNSIHIGLEQDLDNMDPDTLIAAIDSRPRSAPTRIHGKRLTRSKGPSIEIHLSGLNAEVDHYRPGETLVSRSLFLVKDLEILDHIKTSTWRKFVTALRNDSRGNIRETDSNMARVELLTVRPSPHHPAEEARLRVKILPLRLYVDQDALDFFKKFFAFKDADSPAAPNDAEKNKEIYFQHAEVFPVDIKLDYKPRRVDYRALREGRTIELMNFFHFDGAEMTLRHLTLHGITGWPRFFDTLNDLWTPDVKATQLVDVISGVAPIRSMVNVGSGVADLVLLPIAQYKKDGRIVRGVQKGTKAFVQSTAMEAIKLGARLATGTQVILEQTENVLGGQFRDPVTTETLQIPYEDDVLGDSEEDLISRYAAQPSGVGEGVQSAYRSLRKGLHAAAQTILAVPMEVYERSGNEGSVRAVIRAVPIAVLKPMIGASEAVSKTLMGLHNTLDPNVRHENEAKYKHR